MYKLLLVANEQELCDAFASFPDWAQLGFSVPQMVRTAREAMRLIEDGEADAVAYTLPKDEGQAFFTFLAQHPQVQCMEATADPLRIRRALSTLRRTLHQRGQEGVLEDVLPLLQTEFYHSLAQGAPLTLQELRMRVAALQLPVVLDAPVCVARLCLPQGDTYLDEVWRYGRDRLEVALRNFFERDLPDVRYVLHVCTPREMKLLACPKRALSAQALQEHTQAHLARVCAEILEYLDLEVQVREICAYDSLAALCGKQADARA